MKKIIPVFICFLLAGTSVYAQSLELTLGVGAYYNFYPVDGSIFGDLAVLSNLRGGVNIGILGTISKNISFGPELHVAYFILKPDGATAALNLLDVSGRGIVDIKLGRISIKPYFGYSPVIFFGGGYTLLANYLEAGLRFSAVGIYLEGSFLMTMEEGENHFKAGAGYEFRF
ncbi:MAG: hypothetical protein JW874_11740 [Spirochaetales bacterium]|nr:hypothetical protein [Spirochaetales bacterium]